MTMLGLCQMALLDRQSLCLALRADQFEKSNFKGLSRFIRMIDQVLEAQHDLASVAVAPPKDAVELTDDHSQEAKGWSFLTSLSLNMDQDFNSKTRCQEVILQSSKWAWCQIHCQGRNRSSGSTLSEKPLNSPIPSLTYTAE